MVEHRPELVSYNIQTLARGEYNFSWAIYMIQFTTYVSIDIRSFDVWNIESH